MSTAGRQTVRVVPRASVKRKTLANYVLWLLKTRPRAGRRLLRGICRAASVDNP